MVHRAVKRRARSRYAKIRSMKFSRSRGSVNRPSVLEPALADLQHEWNGARSRSALLRNYAAFWQSWSACILRDATSCESRSFDGAALTAFALTIAVAWLMEFA